MREMYKTPKLKGTASEVLRYNLTLYMFFDIIHM